MIGEQKDGVQKMMHDKFDPPTSTLRCIMTEITQVSSAPSKGCSEGKFGLKEVPGTLRADTYDFKKSGKKLNSNTY